MAVIQPAARRAVVAVGLGSVISSRPSYVHLRFGRRGGRLYFVGDYRGTTVYGAPALLGLRDIPADAGANCFQPAGWAGRLRGDADRRGQVALLPTAGGHIRRAHGGGGVSADRADAGPGGATYPDGHSGESAEQLVEPAGAVARDAEGGGGGVPAAVSFAGAPGAAGDGGVAATRAAAVFRD